VLLVGIAAPAFASTTPPADASSAIQQYVEVVPTASGGAAVGVGKPSVKPLAPAQVQQVEEQAGSAAPALQEVATSSAYGVPTKPLHVATTDRKRAVVKKALAPARAKPPKVPSLGSIGATEGGTGRVAGLGVILLATTGIAVAFAVRRRRAV
jgi:hypothetical protein